MNESIEMYSKRVQNLLRQLATTNEWSQRADGMLTVCALCGHGGHSEHMVIWFKENNCCAYGCGCDYTTKNNTIFAMLSNAWQAVH
ncbi:unnamed protein product [Cercopithifilaria johnstoni]|uniref:WDR59/RTC1-like RING zinc finger domain-containing protein n=1 Tax=Cercopithifilaria johnstoni TaxID=2874296 RepID=A0A8J2MQJ6_9BILA|nr:unnamed protein product [Cercopithifilaria johnstoni]